MRLRPRAIQYGVLSLDVVHKIGEIIFLAVMMAAIAFAVWAALYGLVVLYGYLRDLMFPEKVTPRLEREYAARGRIRWLKRRAVPDLNFYQSLTWRTVRRKVLRKNKNKCGECGVSGNDTILFASHIKPRSQFPALERDPNNVQILCELCTPEQTDSEQTDWRWQ